MVKTLELTDAPKTESGATIGSTGQLVDAQTNKLLISRRVKEEKKVLTPAERVAAMLKELKEEGE